MWRADVKQGAAANLATASSRRRPRRRRGWASARGISRQTADRHFVAVQRAHLRVRW